MSQFQRILQWGWNSYFEASWNDGARDGVVPARVIAQQRGFWRVAGEFGECWAEAAGRLRLTADEGADWPAVGDWVAVELRDGEKAAVILEVLPRRSRFVRKSAGKKMEEQVIAANVDTALLVSALDGDFNPRRVERYLAQCWESGAKPVLVLNKADACIDAAVRAAEMECVALGAPVYLISARTGQGFEELEKMLTPGQTFVLLGSSGVGKSTLANRLLGESRQEVQAVREGDSRGRHTTTARELFVLPGGARWWIRRACGSCSWGTRRRGWRKFLRISMRWRGCAASATANMKRNRDARYARRWKRERWTKRGWRASANF